MLEIKKIPHDKHLSVAQITAYHNEYMIYKLSFGKSANPSVVIDSTKFTKVANTSSSAQKKVQTPAGSVTEQFEEYTKPCSSFNVSSKFDKPSQNISHHPRFTPPSPYKNYTPTYLPKGHGYSKLSYYNRRSSAVWRPKQHKLPQTETFIQRSTKYFETFYQNNQKPKQHWIPKLL